MAEVGQFSSDDVVLELSNVRVFRADKELGQGTLTITESELRWKSQEQSERISLDYPDISVHAVAMEEEKEEEEEESEPCEIRLVPENNEQLEEIYAAISECQELYPDPELSSDSELEQEEAEEEKDGSEDEEEEGFFTSADGLQHLTVEGEAVLAHLESILRVSEQSNGSAEGNSVGQFEDADDQ